MISPVKNTSPPWMKVSVNAKEMDVIDALFAAYNSFVSDKIDDYNSSVYYENPAYIFECYKEQKMI